MKKIIAIPIILVIGVLLTGFSTINTGELGVVSRFGKVVDTRPAGLNWTAPLITKVTRIKVSQDKISNVYDVSTSDMQSVITHVTVQFTVDPDSAIDLYTKFGGSYVEGIVEPSVAEAVNAATAHFTIEELVERRAELSDAMQDLAKERLEEYGIRVIAVDITDHEFSDSYEKAVEKKKAAQQETEAKREDVKQAELAAERNKIMADSYTKENYLREFLDKWDGKLPQVVSDTAVIKDILDGTLAEEIKGE